MRRPDASAPSLDEMQALRASFPASLVRTTPLTESERLSHAHGMTVLLKEEDRQTVRSYKVRGAAAKVLRLSHEEQQRGVVCASAGNHAQGVAACCNLLEREGTIFMPRSTPTQKIDATHRRGNGHVTIRLEGDVFDQTSQIAQTHASESGATYIHPFDDWEVIAGQGTVALEIAEQLSERREKLRAVLVPVGGGGLLAGTVLALRDTHPETLIIGVEPEGAACMRDSVRTGRPVKLPHVDTFVDGAAVAEPGQRPFSVVAEAVREGRVRLMTVSKNLVCAAMTDLLQIDGRVVEPAGALSVAALEEFSLEDGEGAVVSILSGGNFDMRRMPTVLRHTELHRRTKIYVRITLPDRPQALQEMLDALAPALSHVNICYMAFDAERDESLNEKAAPLSIGFESKTGDPADIERILLTLRTGKSPFLFEELSEKPGG